MVHDISYYFLVIIEQSKLEFSKMTKKEWQNPS